MKISTPAGGIIRICFGGFFVTIFILSLFVDSKDSSGSITEFYMGALFYLILGALLLIFGIKAKNRSKRFRQYVALISGEHMTSLQNLAGATSQPLDFVRKDLQKMIDKKFFKNASLNLNTDELVFGNLEETPLTQATEKTARKTLNCPGCGAVNPSKANGSNSNCEYCGTPLE